MQHGNAAIWPIEPHTKAKHAILSYYLRAWLAIQSKVPKRLLYIDGFAGPGEYEKGEPGSPLLALKVACEPSLLSRLTKTSMELVFLFIEERGDRFLNLQQKVNSFKRPSNFQVQVVKNTFENTMGQVFDHLAEQAKMLAPSFVFIDPFGPTGFPMYLLEKLAKQPRAEVLINFSYQPLNQWFLQDPLKHARLEKLFGGPGWKPALQITDSTQKENFLVQEYRQALQQHGWHGPIFRMVNWHNQTQYYLLFGTTHYLGMLAMKRAMWRAAPEGTFEYSDRSNPDQPRLFLDTYDEEYSQELAQLIWQKRKGSFVSKQAIVEDELAWHPTAIEKHLTRALKILELESKPPKIVDVKKMDNSLRRRGTYPESSTIQFAA